MTDHPGRDALRRVTDWARNLEGGLASELREVAAYVAEMEAQVAELLAGPHWVRIVPMTNDDGVLCGLCDGTYRHIHPRVKCSRCGAEGLQENWPFDCCGLARTAPKPNEDDHD